MHSLPVSSSTDSLKLAHLRVGTGHYALDIMCIREVIRSMAVIPVPKAPEFVDGVIHLRKAVIPVIDLRQRFGLPPAPEQETKRRIVICTLDGRVIGLLVDEVTEVCNCQLTDLRPTPYYLQGEEVDFFPAVCRKGDILMMLLDLRLMLANKQKIVAGQLDAQLLSNHS